MRNLEDYFKNRKIVTSKLEKYGFIKNNSEYTYRKKILNDQFEVIITILKETKEAKVIDLISEEEYLLVDIAEAVGEFVGTVKEVYESIIQDFISKCTTRNVFKSEQAKKVIEYIAEKYGDELEFLWEKFDNNAIWRNKVNQKWYCLILSIPKSKIGLDSEDIIEVIDVLYEKGNTAEVVDNVGIFPGYHMNKKSWITIKLDGTVDIDKIFELIDNSYILSLGKNK